MIYTLYWTTAHSKLGRQSMRSQSTKNLQAVLKWSNKLEKEGYKDIEIHIEFENQNSGDCSS